ncbi:hypothetical protein TTHERM_00348250 (macronuclear) [Tetrahymena thermophila SB210]|uniref:Uncharacterized protein n=1 Tax=Tetrahymena thermophila (strain SB210) TaxID=312017 RepID=I7M398_TETTS|nr:hypothetical protein TTHERM_00348250 [Tetrahymena thermophila SB210]EAS02735.2 hypothetical protein TTHERM_00348250 [Tetrahymena thermophila SB210]|eukprot:XP_001022980.2 hypothetical protein TTHERM_00348250 [Tetrahymena thermophila SB210]
MNVQNSMDQFSENQSSISDISAKQQYNFQKLKQHSDFLANFVRDNNISLNDNPSVESKIMETPQRSDIVGIKQGQIKSYITSPPSQRTYQEGNRNIQNLIKEETDQRYHDIINQKSSNKIKKYEQQDDSSRNSYQFQKQREQNDLQNSSDTKLKENIQQKDYQEDNYENEDDYHSKGHRVINTIDNIFNKMKTKYKMDFSLKEIQKHLNIPDSTAGNSANSSRQNFESNSQGDITLSQLNQNQRLLQIQDFSGFDYETNPDSIVQKIKNKVLSRQGNQFDIQQEQVKYNSNQAQTTQEFKEKLIENKKNEIKKRLSPSRVQNKNSINQIDEHDADMEIERIKTRIFNRNSETKKTEESPQKIEQVPNKIDNQKIQEIDSKATKKINKKHPIYNSSDSSEEDAKNPKNSINSQQKTSKKINNQDYFKNKNDKLIYDEEVENKKNQKNVIPTKENNMKNEQVKNKKMEKHEDESLKALEQISQNKINFKENIKKLKQIFKNNFDLQKCKDDDEEEAQHQIDKQNQNFKNYNQIQQYQQGRDSELEYSQDHQNFFYDEDTVTTKEHIVINDQSENFIGKRKPQSYNQQFGVDNDEIADMDSEVFNISPDHHPQNDHHLNSIPDENHTISIFNENQSLQASFLEQSIFQKSPRQSQAAHYNNNNTFSQQINKRANQGSSPSPILNTQIQGQILQDSFQKNPQNYRQNNQKTINQPHTQNIQSQSETSLSQNKINQGQINNSVINKTQNYVQSDLQSSYQHNNASNLSYSQSMHEQSQIYQNEQKKYQNDQQYQNYTLGERILPLIEEEDERLQKIYETDPILQKLHQEKSGLEFELSKWENILQELNRQSNHLQ